MQIRGDVLAHSHENIMTSSNRNIFRVTDLLCGEFTSHRWIPLTKTNDSELWYPFWSAPGQPVEQKSSDALQWRHNGSDSVSNHQLHDCFLNRRFRHRSKKIPKLRVTGLCAGNSPEGGEFPAQMASYAENVSIWWRHHMRRNRYRCDVTVMCLYKFVPPFCVKPHPVA